MSDEPPATKGMITLMGFVGQACAPAGTREDAAAASSAAAVLTIRFTGFALQGFFQVYNERLSKSSPEAPMRAGLALALLVAAFSAAAQTYPNKPIRVVVPYAAG